MDLACELLWTLLMLNLQMVPKLRIKAATAQPARTKTW
jgi:hypothetical protein